MKQSISIVIVVSILAFAGCRLQEKQTGISTVIGHGQVPDITTDKDHQLHVVYGNGDSIMYTASGDGGKTFSDPQLVAALPALAASHMRGPQITSTGKGLVVMAVTTPGDIYAYTKEAGGEWIARGKITDIDTVAKEGLMEISSDGQLVYAAWLDLRDKHNKLVGAKSIDGGKTWSKNNTIYASPDTTVCECCKPSVGVQGQTVFVMFRNWLRGNRDMYLIRSSNAGDSFEAAQKLGEGSWALNGCPMDGGGFILNGSGIPETVWRRKQTIYACTPGGREAAIGEGKGCSITAVNDKNVYAWTNNGKIIVRNPQGETTSPGKGQQPLLSNNGNGQVICIWENEKEIHAAAIDL